MKKIKLYFSAVVLGVLAVSCDADADNLGLQFFDNEAKGEVEIYDLIAYNVDNQEQTRSDSYVLKNTTLGAFKEEQFGEQKSAYLTQVRMSNYASNFGTNPVVDSVVLEVQPFHYSEKDSIQTFTKKLNYRGVEAEQTLTAYNVVKYGKAKKTLTINVKEIISDLGKVGDEILSNKNFTTGQTLGTKVFDGKATAVNIKKTSDNSVLLSQNAGVRISLDKDFFQNKIVNKKGNAELANEEAFVNYFKGLKVEVQENDGYFITFNPNEISLKMYYTSGEVDNRTSLVYHFNMGEANVHFSQISFKRSDKLKSVIAKSNTTTGDELLYLQGIGGNGAGIKLEGKGIEALKASYKQKKNPILSAKIRLYVDDKNWNNSYTKPTGFLVKEKGATEFIPDLKALASNVNYRLVKTYTENQQTYYDIDITKTIKNIVENGDLAKDLIINVGDYLYTNGNLVKENFNNNAYTPYRVVLVGTDSSNPNRARLIITRITK